MNSELFKTIYMGAVIALAAVAVLHLVNRNKGGGAGGDKNKWTKCAAGSPADKISPLWWTRSPVNGPRVARPHGSRSLAGF
jgi:hypothetical protein